MNFDLNRSKAAQSLFILITLVFCLSAHVAAPPAASAQPDGKLIILVPQFVAEAVRFKAIDESGFDWPGSDEVYAVFSDLNPNLTDLVTSTFENVNTGTTRDFGPDERCIAPRSNKCDHGVSEILHFKVSFWEEDGRSDSFFPPTFVMQTAQAYTIFYVTENAPGMI